jgi:hypothetical protein
MATFTKQEVASTVAIVKAIAETIKELGSVPSGHLYAQLMGRMSLDQYNQIIAMLVRADLVHLGGDHLITWTGPKD